MTEILLGPTLTGGATTKVKDKSTGDVYYKKQILPEGKYKYRTKSGEDVELDLTAPQHQTFVDSFKNKAYDEVPFQIGHGDDKDLKARKGTMANVEYVPGKGTWGYFKLEQDAAQYVEKYPNFGVSPRLVLDLNRMDGKKFAGAIQHVAGTVVPRASGMSPWEKVELSDDEQIDGAEIFDFSDETITAHKDVKETPVTKTMGTGEGEKTFTLSQDEYNFFQEQMKAYQEIMKTEDDKDKKPAPTSVTLSEEDKQTIADAKKAALDAAAGLASIKAQAIRDAWVAKKQLLLSQGVPPAALDLADPVMTDVDAKVYDLSDADGDTVKIDARTQMLNLLETMKGTVDLGGERGHGITGIGSEEDVTEDQMRAWMSANGI